MYKRQLQRIDFFIIENLGNEKSEEAIKLSEKIIEVLSSGKVDKIIELKEVANNYLADQEVVEREEMPLSKNTNELASMTDISTTSETSSSNKANETKTQDKQKQQSAQKEANQNFLDSLCENGAENIEQIDRGYQNIEKRLNAIGAKIQRIEI